MFTLVLSSPNPYSVLSICFGQAGTYYRLRRNWRIPCDHEPTLLGEGHSLKWGDMERYGIPPNKSLSHMAIPSAKGKRNALRTIPFCFSWKFKLNTILHKIKFKYQSGNIIYEADSNNMLTTVYCLNYQNSSKQATMVNSNGQSS